MSVRSSPLGTGPGNGRLRAVLAAGAIEAALRFLPDGLEALEVGTKVGDSGRTLDGDRNSAIQTLISAADSYFEKRFSRREREQKDAFEAAAVLVAYACERIIVSKRLVGTGDIDGQVKRALRAILYDAASVVANTTSVSWFRVNVKGGILPYLKSSVMMRTLDVEDGSEEAAVIEAGRERYGNKCFACGREDLSTAYVVQMAGWKSSNEVYDVMAPNTWNMEKILSDPQSLQDPFRTFYEQYNGAATYSDDPTPVRQGAWTKAFILGKRCHAMCQHHHIARSFLVESLYAVTINIRTAQKDKTLVSMKVPEMVNSLNVPDTGGVMQHVPAMLQTISSAALAGPDSERLASAPMYTTPLFDADVYKTLQEESARERAATRAATSATVPGSEIPPAALPAPPTARERKRVEESRSGVAGCRPAHLQCALPRERRSPTTGPVARASAATCAVQTPSSC